MICSFLLLQCFFNGFSTVFQCFFNGFSTVFRYFFNVSSMRICSLNTLSLYRISITEPENKINRNRSSAKGSICAMVFLSYAEMLFPDIKIPPDIFVPGGTANTIFRHPFKGPVHFVRDYIIPIPPAPPAGIAGVSSLMLPTTASVVSREDATLVAFCRADLVTFAGSRMPASTMSTYTSL